MVFKKNDSFKYNFGFIDFFSYRNYGFLFSLILTVATILGYYILSLNFGIDFKGGTVIEIIPSDHNLVSNMPKTLLRKNITVKSSGQSIILSLQNNKDNISSSNVAFIKSEILKIDPHAQFIKIDYVGPKITEDLMRKSFFAFLCALFIVILYILIRFDWKFSIGASLSLIHDLTASIGFFVFTRYEFNITSIAAILTIVGYSVNDSVVIFDRIRENTLNKQNYINAKIVNQSINDTLSRTIMTFLTTFVACVSLWYFGGESLRSFGGVITFGVAFGTYSSIFLSANLLPYLNKK